MTLSRPRKSTLRRHQSKSNSGSSGVHNHPGLQCPCKVRGCELPDCEFDGFAVDLEGCHVVVKDSGDVLLGEAVLAVAGEIKGKQFTS